MNETERWKIRFWRMFEIWLGTLVFAIFMIGVAKVRIDNLLESNPIDQIDDVRTEISELQNAIDELENIEEQIKEQSE